MTPEGDCAPAFTAVRAAFVDNFERRGELGAAVAVYVDGKRVVNVWGGLADEASGKPWRHDTLQSVYSTSKGVAATVVALLVDRGLLDYDAPVSTWWPRFAANGKGAITLRQLMSHQAGLPYVVQDVPLDKMGDLDWLRRRLEAAAPAWPPGTACGYHAMTLGMYAAELVHRVTGDTIGQVIARDLAGPLGAELYLGLPVAEHGRASVIRQPGVEDLDDLGFDLESPLVLAMFHPESLTAKVFSNFPELSADPDAWNSARIWSQELPAGNVMTTADGLARVYAMLAEGGQLDGTRLLAPTTVKTATETQVAGRDLVVHDELAFALGWMKPSPGLPFSTNAEAFGHPGAGGSMAFADPVARVGFAYVMNRFGTGLLLDPRAAALIDALYGCLA